jgi:hypothetical protein
MVIHMMFEYINNRFFELNIEKNTRIGIYGTGTGSTLIHKLLKKYNLDKNVVCIIDNDAVVKNDVYFLDIKVSSLNDAYNKVDVIFVGAEIHHNAITDRIYAFIENQKRKIIVIDLFKYNNTEKTKNEYLKYIEKNIFKNKDDFVNITEKGIDLNTSDPKIIAWYLPQYHRISINDKFHGAGFTEWTNTSAMLPLFTGHYQPHIPYDVGYYDLTNENVFKRQIELAKMYGIYGFSFYYYWFSGKRIMEKPVEAFLNNKDLNMPFCITWANENWTSLWDAGNKEVIFSQEMRDGDSERFIKDIVPYFMDERYIKIDGNPLFILYRGSLWNKEITSNFINDLKKNIKKYGFNDVYVLVTNSYDFDGPAEIIGADGEVEFPPHKLLEKTDKYIPECYVNPNFGGTFWSMKNFLQEKRYLYKHKSKKYYRGVFPSWDNSSRKATDGACIFTDITLTGFKQWLKDVILESKRIHENEDNFVFINAWNEWAEGAHLEPDQRYGYAYLQAVKEVIKESR